MKNEEAGRSDKRQEARHFRDVSFVPSSPPEFRTQSKGKPLWRWEEPRVVGRGSKPYPREAPGVGRAIATRSRSSDVTRPTVPGVAFRKHLHDSRKWREGPTLDLFGMPQTHDLPCQQGDGAFHELHDIRRRLWFLLNHPHPGASFANQNPINRQGWHASRLVIGPEPGSGTRGKGPGFRQKRPGAPTRRIGRRSPLPRLARSEK